MTDSLANLFKGIKLRLEPKRVLSPLLLGGGEMGKVKLLNFE